jgi:alkylation response protein AidB-like acyl-CoA dehydrogenase
MDFAFTPDEQALREAVRRFVDERAVPVEGAEAARLRRSLPGDGRWRAYAWPVDFGGQGGTATEQFIVEEEFCRAGFRLGAGGTAAPQLLAWGSDAQRQRWLGPIVRGEVRVAPALSEPHCGTDLAAVRLAGRREPGGYRLDGTKVYVSGVCEATHLMVLARTQPGSQRRRGLSLLLVPVEAAGLRIEALPTVQSAVPAPSGTIFGDPMLHRIVFEDVGVSEDARIGADGEGWKVLGSGLNQDRVSARAYVNCVRQTEAFIDWLRSGDGVALRDDVLVRDTAASLWIEREVCRLLAWNTLSKVACGQAPAPQSLLEAVWGPQHAIRAG